MAHHFKLGNRSCWTCPVGGDGAAGETVLFFPCEKEMTEMLPGISAQLDAAAAEGRCKPFVLAGFESGEWEKDFTPWEAPRLFKRITRALLWLAKPSPEGEA